MTKQNNKIPEYAVKIVSDGKSHYIMGKGTQRIVEELTFGIEERELAYRAKVTLVNIKLNSKRLSKIINLKDVLYIYIKTANSFKQIFKGYIWNRGQGYNTEKILELTAYDKLIYLQNSNDIFFFAKGKKTESVIRTICERWGIVLDYHYKSITHGKLVFRDNRISDTVIEVLEAVKKKTGVDYTVYSKNGKMIISSVGNNETVYSLRSKQDVISVSSNVTMDDMITKVLIIGQEKKDGSSSILTSVNGNTKEYGTLQRILTKEKDGSIEDVKKEAQEMLNESGKPYYSRNIMAIDNPYIRKGDAVQVKAGDLNGLYIVQSIQHDVTSGTMSLEVKKKK